MQGGEIAFTIEGVEVGTQSGLLPDTLAWFAGATILRYRFHSNNVESVFHALERLVCKYGVVGFLGILQEDRHLFFRISFCHVGDVDALVGIRCRLQGFVWGRIVALVMNQNVL